MKVHQLLEDEDDKAFNVKLMVKLIDKAGYLVKTNKNGSITVNVGGSCSSDIFYQKHDGNWHMQIYKGGSMRQERANLSPEEVIAAINSACDQFVDNTE